MAVIDSTAMASMSCVQRVPGGRRCRFSTDDERAMLRHCGDHGRLDQYGYWWDNCQRCGLPIRLTASFVLRVHGPRGQLRCPGGGLPGTFQLRCTGRAR